ncbi:hypothetical protein J8F10_13525 [Gemmata sp. G18]|uniref:Uncharacterized protein n=1 Tax=Gemmata palustris TaxID=2822762 RepID=A0ABS5BRF0_9BACT|nr:hypothetical protein [Gemmata palustris]MBP3956305.1 hypothetical protein [Gemmata palustris]
MTVAKVRILDGPIYTLSHRTWSGPDPEWVDFLNTCYRANSTIGDPVISAAHQVAKDWCGEVLSIEKDPDFGPDNERADLNKLKH